MQEGGKGKKQDAGGVLWGAVVDGFLVTPAALLEVAKRG